MASFKLPFMPGAVLKKIGSGFLGRIAIWRQVLEADLHMEADSGSLL
jgi:hypothetical protein